MAPLFFYRQDGDRGGAGPPQDLKGFLTNDLIDYCSCRDKERIRKMARHWT
jgi:hypothetical protein